MKKTININLGGYPFTIDEDAYEVAENYLNTLARHFGGGEGATEIMQDIESRMGELINRHKGTRSIVSKDDIVQVISILGTPEELKGIDFEDVGEKTRTKTGESFQLKTGKRLYRDPDDKVIGGVCSGLASYFGIQDPIWIRILFVLLATAGGASFIVYVVLWAILPEARTVSEKLEMMGEPTNVNNIAKAVKDELEDLGEKLNKQFNKKKKKHRYHHHDTPDDQGPMHSAGWSWRWPERPEQPKPADVNRKDFV